MSLFNKYQSEDLNDVIEEQEKLKKRLDILERGFNDDEYENFLNESFGDLKVCGHSYQAGHVLKIVDRVAFNMGLNNYNNEEITKLKEKIEYLEEDIKNIKESIDKNENN
jgi:hypothetical protein